MSLDYPVTSSDVPAIPSKRRSPKLIMVDSGITNFVAGIQIEYLQNKELLDTWRGRAAEQIVAQELRVLLDRNYKEHQYYWIRDKKGTTSEMDFVWQTSNQIIPIEVKAGTNSHLRSLHSYVNNAGYPVTAIRFWSGEFFVQEASTPAPDNKPYRLINIPFYYIGQLQTILRNESDLQKVVGCLPDFRNHTKTCAKVRMPTDYLIKLVLIPFNTRIYILTNFQQMI